MKYRREDVANVHALSMSKRSPNPSFTVKEEKEEDVSSPNASVSVSGMDEIPSAVSRTIPQDLVVSSPRKRKRKSKEEIIVGTHEHSFTSSVPQQAQPLYLHANLGRLETTSSSSSVLAPSSSRSGICTLSPTVQSTQKANRPRLSRRKERSGTGRKLLNKAKRSAGRTKERRNVKRGFVENSDDEKPPEADHSEEEGVGSEWKGLLCGVVEEGVQDVIRGVLDGEHQSDDDEETEGDYRSPASSAIHQGLDDVLKTQSEAGEEAQNESIRQEAEEREKRCLNSKRRLEHGGYKLWDDGEYDNDGVDSRL